MGKMGMTSSLYCLLWPRPSYLYYDCVPPCFRILHEYTKGLIVWPVKISPLRKPILQTIDKGFEINNSFRAI